MDPNNKPIFLLRPSLFTGESLTSYIFRMAKMNYHDSNSFLADTFGISYAKFYNNEFDNRTLVRIAQLTKHDLQNISAMSNLRFHKSWGEMIYNKFVMKNRIKFCPSCIEENYYHHLIWSFYPVAICLNHATFLHDRCVHCNSIITMTVFMDGICSCGAQYQEFPTIKLNPSSVYFQSQQELHDQIENNQKSGMFKKLQFGDYYNLIHRSFYILEGLKSFIEDKTQKIEAFHCECQ